MVDATDTSTMRGVSSEEISTESANLDYKRKYEEAMATINKMMPKRTKRTKKEKRKHIKLKDIPEKEHLPFTPKYQLSRFTKSVLWKCVKFWNGELEEHCFRKAAKHLGLKKPEERLPFKNYIIAFIEEHIVIKRNNTIGSIKRMVCNDTEGGK